uniref:hypothetical protein n=1 Tax=Flavobacterium sp. TaxID=239 RepID=UPI003340515C
SSVNNHIIINKKAKNKLMRSESEANGKQMISKYEANIEQNISTKIFFQNYEIQSLSLNTYLFNLL